MTDLPTPDQPTPAPTPNPQPDTPKATLKSQFIDQVIDLRNQGLTFDQIAKQLNLNRNTIATWISDELQRQASQQATAHHTMQTAVSNPGDVLHHRTLEAAKRSLKANQSDDDELAQRYTESRSTALETLIRAARGKKVSGPSIAAAKEILKQQPIKPREQLSQLAISKIEELAERSLVCACSMMGVEAVQKLLDDLKAGNQLSVL